MLSPRSREREADSSASDATFEALVTEVRGYGYYRITIYTRQLLVTVRVGCIVVVVLESRPQPQAEITQRG